MKLLRVVGPLAFVMLAACSKNIQTNDAVRQAVIKHLSENKGLSLSSMDIEVGSVTFKDNEADATVSFKPKGGAAASGMTMHYTLNKKGNEWVVAKKADSGGGHGQGGAPMDGAMPGGLPPGHPPPGAGAKP